MSELWQNENDILLGDAIASGRLTSEEIKEISSYLYSARELERIQNKSISDLREISFLYRKFESLVKKALPGRLSKSKMEPLIGIDLRIFEIRHKIDKVYFFFGLFFLVLAILPYFTDVLFIPRKYNAKSLLYKSNNPTEFYEYWIALWCVTIFILIHSKFRFYVIAEPIKQFKNWSRNRFRNEDPNNLSAAYILFSLSPFILIFAIIILIFVLGENS